MEAELTGDLRLTSAAVLRMQWSQHEEQPKAPSARSARRDRVPPGVIAPEQGEEEQGDQEEASVTCTDSEESSDEQDGSPQDTTRTPLSEDSHQHGLMLAAYRDVGNDYAVDKGQLAKGLKALQGPESEPRRWPLARLTVPLWKCWTGSLLAAVGKWSSPGRTLMTQLARCDKQPGAWHSRWRAICLSLLPRPYEPPRLRKVLSWLIRKIYIFLLQITGSNPFLKSCCMRLLGTLPVWKEKGSDPAMG